MLAFRRASPTDTVAGLRPIVCVGERLEEREGNATEAVLATQFAGGIAGLLPEQFARVTLAYEPVWAIGTGRTATPETAQQNNLTDLSSVAPVAEQMTLGAPPDCPTAAFCIPGLKKTYGIGVKELWEVPSGRIAKGEVIYTMGYPLTTQEYGGAWIYGPSLTAVMIDSTGFHYSSGGFDPDNLTTNDIYRVNLDYTASNSNLVMTLTRNNEMFVSNRVAQLGGSFTDFHVDAISISSYSQAGQDINNHGGVIYAGSILAHGTVDNIVVTLPPPSVQQLTGTFGNGTSGFVQSTNAAR